MLTILLAACKPALQVVPTDPPAPSSTTTTSSAGPVVVDAVTAPMIRPAEGAALEGLSGIDDLTGDGVADAVVSVATWTDERGWASRDQLVVGPLVDRVIPDDGVDLPGSVVAVGEMDGVAPADVLVRALDATTTTAVSLVPGPLPAAGPVILPPASWTPATVELDLDGDGVLDRLDARGSASQELWITWGPADRWSGPPDVTIGLCRDGEQPDDEWISWNQLSTPGDLDGDGRPELAVGAFGWFYDGTDCGQFTVSVPESGAIDPFAPSAAGVWDRTALFAVPVGDWDGDGAPELLDAQPDIEWGSGWAPTSELWRSPTLDATGLAVQGAVPLPDDTLWVERLPFDLDGDGGLELLAFSDAPADGSVAFAVIPSDVEAYGVLPAEVADLGGYSYAAFLDDGRGALAVIDMDGALVRVDLGPAPAGR